MKSRKPPGTRHPGQHLKATPSEARRNTASSTQHHSQHLEAMRSADAASSSRTARRAPRKSPRHASCERPRQQRSNASSAAAFAVVGLPTAPLPASVDAAPRPGSLRAHTFAGLVAALVRCRACRSLLRRGQESRRAQGARSAPRAPSNAFVQRDAESSGAVRAAQIRRYSAPLETLRARSIVSHGRQPRSRAGARCAPLTRLATRGV